MLSHRTATASTLAAILIALILAGCNLSQGDNAANEEMPSSDAAGIADAGSGGTPSVQIVSPVDGQQVPANQRVDITVETDSTTTGFQINVGGRVASSVALPPGQSGPTEAILAWQPDHEGTFTLQVFALNGSQVSDPAALTLLVSGTASSNADGSGECTARVMVAQLNFRSGAGTNTSRLGQFNTGETVRVIGRNADTTWYKVERAVNDQQVWTINNSQWLQPEGRCGTALPVVD